MIGKVKSKEVCPVCNNHFIDTGKELRCPEHLTRPKTFYAYFYHEKDHRIYGFLSYRDVVDYLIDVQRAIKNGKFDFRNYKARSLKQFRFKNFLYTWLEARERDCQGELIAPSYMRKLSEYATRFEQFFQYDDIRTIKRPKLKDFLFSLQKDGLGKKTQKNIMAALQKLLHDAYKEWELISEMPLFPQISYELPQIQWIDEQTQDAILEHIPAEHHPILKFLFLYGCRVGEARALQNSDIDNKKGLITIQRTFSETKLRPYTKTKRRRELPLFDDVSDMIAAQPRYLNCQFVFNDHGTAYSETKLGKLWRAACDQLNIKVTLYSGTRHSAASQLYNRGVNIAIIKELLGHTKIDMTLRYSHVAVDSLRAALKGSSRVVTLKDKIKQNQ